MKQFIIQNYYLKLGQNAQENWLLLDNSKNYHIFMHLTCFPSPYLIIEFNQEKEPPDTELMKEIGLLLKNNTKYKKMTLKVDYCKCDNLEKTEKVGEVIFKSNRKVCQIIV